MQELDFLNARVVGGHGVGLDVGGGFEAVFVIEVEILVIRESVLEVAHGMGNESEAVFDQGEGLFLLLMSDSLTDDERVSLVEKLEVPVQEVAVDYMVGVHVSPALQEEVLFLEVVSEIQKSYVFVVSTGEDDVVDHYFLVHHRGMDVGQRY